MIRQAFIEAREYKKQWDDYNQRKAAGAQNLIPPRRDVQMDPLVEVLEGKRYVHAHCYRADEIVMLIRVANEFGFKVRTFQHVLEGYKIADEIAASGAGGSTFSDWWAYKMEAIEAIPYNASLMTERGVVVSVNSDDAQEARQLNQEAAKSMKYGGLSANDALKLITLNPAIQLGIDRRAGSIDVGKDADLAIYNRDPLSVYAVVQKTLIDGQVYFDRQRDIANADEIQSRLRSGELKFAIEIPTNYGHDLITQQTPEIGAWINGDMPFRAETTRGYLGGVMQSYLADLSERLTGKATAFSPINIEERFRYNQAFKSIYSEVPSTIMVMLILIPAIMTALGVVREVETGSIANFRSTPVTRVEFLLGKQLPYVLIGVSSFATLVILAIFVFGVPVKGSWAALIAGGFLCVCAATGFGLLVSTIVRTQVAAVFGTTCIALIPTVSFSGLLVPVSSLAGAGRAIGSGFPSSWFQQISVGAFTKGLGFSELWINHLALAIFTVLFIAMAALILRKQEA